MNVVTLPTANNRDTNWTCPEVTSETFSFYTVIITHLDLKLSSKNSSRILHEGYTAFKFSTVSNKVLVQIMTDLYKTFRS